MKTFATIAVVAVVAIVLVEINESFAQRRRCSSRHTPPLNTTEVTCQTRGHLGRRIACALVCLRCYGRENLQRGAGCLVDNKCTCLAKPGNEASTTEGSSGGTSPEDGSSSSGPELPTSTDLPELPSSSPSDVETTPGQDVTTPSQDVTTPEAPSAP